MPAQWETFSALSLPPPIAEEDSPSSDYWDGRCAGVSQRCSSLPSSDCESLTSSNSFSEYDIAALDNISLPDSDLLSDPEGELLCSSLLKQIHHCLTRAKISSLRCSRLLLPDELLRHLGQELLHLAYSEPCGLRGALIDLCLEHGKDCYNVAQLSVDQCVVPTFQLSVLLRLDSRFWPRLQGLFSTRPAPGFGQSLKLSPGFKVLKKKLYSSEEFIIEEC